MNTFWIVFLEKSFIDFLNDLVEYPLKLIPFLSINIKIEKTNMKNNSVNKILK